MLIGRVFIRGLETLDEIELLELVRDLAESTTLDKVVPTLNLAVLTGKLEVASLRSDLRVAVWNQVHFSHLKESIRIESLLKRMREDSSATTANALIVKIDLDFLSQG